MKITLIYPRYQYKNIGNVEEPLGMLYIASALKDQGHDVFFHDLTFEKTLSNLDEDIKTSNLIGISSSSALFGIAITVLNHIRKVKKDSTVVIGGPHATYDPVSALDKGFDYVILGEGERIIIELVNNLGKADISSVKGIAFKKIISYVSMKERVFVII